jgi:hypothetical protein
MGFFNPYRHRQPRFLKGRYVVGCAPWLAQISGLVLEAFQFGNM